MDIIFLKPSFCSCCLQTLTSFCGWFGSVGALRREPTSRRVSTTLRRASSGSTLEGSPTLHNCLMYKLCYYRLGQLYTEGGKPSGYDRVRHAEIGNKDFELDVVEEAYTTEHWVVRIYKVKDLPNRGV